MRVRIKMHWFRCLLLLAFCGLAACHTARQTATMVKEKTLIAEYANDWLRYWVYLLPGDNSELAGKQKENLRLSIMVVNMKDNTSPLRKRCTNLDEYNQYYEYLLNSCKNDIVVRDGKKELYPVYYAFENNYDAFPFETINIGFEYDLRKKGLSSLHKLQLIYTDKVFSQAVINCKLNNPNK